MPAPSDAVIMANLKQALKDNGLTKKEYDENGNLVDTGDLTDEMKLICAALAKGINQTWTTWQATQTVTGVSTSPSGPGTITGTLP